MMKVKMTMIEDMEVKEKKRTQDRESQSADNQAIENSQPVEEVKIYSLKGILKFLVKGVGQVYLDPFFA